MSFDDRISKSPSFPVSETKIAPAVMPKIPEQPATQTDWQKIRAQYASMSRHERLLAAWQTLAKNGMLLEPDDQPA